MSDDTFDLIYWIVMTIIMSGFLAGLIWNLAAIY